MAKLTDEEAKALHIKDARKALVDLELDKNIDELAKEARTESLLEFITLIETGKNDHINAQEEVQKDIPHFK